MTTRKVPKKARQVWQGFEKQEASRSLSRDLLNDITKPTAPLSSDVPAFIIRVYEWGCRVLRKETLSAHLNPYCARPIVEMLSRRPTCEFIVGNGPAQSAGG